MKNRVISALLTLCMIVGILGVLPISIPTFAATVQSNGYYAKRGTATDSDVTTVVLNRDFEDGTVINNGMTSAGSTFSEAVTLEKADGNTYVKFTNMGNHDYLQPPLGTYAPNSGSVVMQLDVMVDSTSVSLPGILQLNPLVRGSSSDVYTIGQFGLSSSKTAFQPLPANCNYKYSVNANQWYTVTYVWSYTSQDSVTVTCFNGMTSSVYQYVDKANADTGCTDVRPGTARIGITASSTGSWYMDNLIIYTTEETDPYEAANHTVNSSDRGAAFNAHADMYVDPDSFSGNYFLKLGAKSGLTASDERIELTLAPFEYEGEIYIPYSSLTKLGFTSSQIPSSKAKVVNGVKSIALGDMYSLTGYYGVSSSMGLIMLTKTEGLVIDGVEKSFVTIMKKFLFDNINPDLTAANVFSVEDMVSLDHPYIYANQEKFDALYEEYLNPTDSTLSSYITTHANSAKSIYNGYASVSNGEYVGLKNTSIAKMPYTDNGGYGYDVGGRQGDSATHNERIYTLAFGYQLTRNEDYARLAYDYAIAMGKWEHWGPGHFLNVADASAPYAVAYDWLYDVWVELGLDVTAIETIMFTHSILPSYYAKHDNGCPWYDPVVSSGWNYHSRTNNWNAVCSAGVTMASLALIGLETEVAGTMLDIEIDGVYNPEIDSYAGTSGTITRKDGKSFTTDSTGMDTYRDFCEYLINGVLYDLPYYGMGQYVPDGSYIESNGYWSYGTNNFYETTAALTSTTGNDYGLLDCWGIDKTNYFALNTMSGDYQSWNYHDSGSVGAQDTSWFIYLGTEDGLGDKTLAGIRKHIIEDGGSTPSKYDILYYMTDEEIGEWEMPDVQYHMEGIHGYAVRDSWDRGSIFAGIMGEANNVTHGQIDSGAFIYYSNGVRWFCDVGTENYNAYQFWGDGRHSYYKMNAEGNNTLILTSRQDDGVPFGQIPSGFGYMTDTFDNEYGAYTVIDNTNVYGRYAVSAKRGMLFTNDRRTLVIQDEVEFAEEESFAWIGHTMSEVIISVDGKTAYMYDGGNVLKVTLIDENNLGLKFELTDTYDFLLDCTVGPTYSVDNGGQPEGDRSAYKRLIIRKDGVKNLKMAVVIEEVAVGETTNADIGYEFCDMDNWVPTRDGRIENRELSDVDFDGGDASDVSCGGNMTAQSAIIGNDYALSIGFADEGETGEISILAKENLVEYGSLGRGYVTAEFDLSTLSSLPENASVGIGSKGGVITSVTMGELGTVAASKWVRVSIVLDIDSYTAYYFLSDSLVASRVYPHHSFENLCLRFTSEGGAGTGTILVDNVRIRAFTEDYAGLADVVAHGSISSWEDATPAMRSAEGEYAVAYIVSEEYCGDTPLVDIPMDSTSYSEIDANGAVKRKITEIYSFEELESALYEGAYVELLADNEYSAVNVTVPCEIDRKGHVFKATSENYVTRIEGDHVYFEEGEIKVKWVVGSITYTETYTGTVTATYKRTLASTIYETDNGDGTYSYYTKSGWSKTEGGEPIDEDEMTVTSENCVFYLAKEAYDGAFVTVSGSTIVGYPEISSFFTSAVMNGAFDRVSLTADSSYDSTSIADSVSMTKTFNLYLNGYTLTYDTTDSSDHMFTPYSATNTVSIYGPGTLESVTTSANIIYQNGKFYAEDVTFSAPRNITDTRSDLGHYKNCTIIVTKGAAAFSTTNRNNAVTSSSRMPSLVIDGCEVNILQSSSTTAAFIVNSNSSIEITGGTTVNVAYGNGTLFGLQNNTIGTVTDYDYANGYAYMKAIIGDVSYNSAGGIYSCSTNDPSGTVYDMGDRIFYGEGASFETPPEESRILDGLVVARSAGSTKPYVLVSEENAALVEWMIGTESVEEYWADGTIPRPDSSDVKEFISNFTPVANKKYTFGATEVEGGAAYTFSAIEIQAFEIYVNMSLEADFALNLFIPMEIDGVEVTGYTVDGESYDISEAPVTTIDGETYYKIKKANLAPSEAASSVRISVTLKSDAGESSINLNLSILDYAQRILSSEQMSDEVKMLMANVLKYVINAYEYTENTASSDYVLASELYKNYKALATASVVVREKKELGAIADAIDSAVLNLSESPNFRFNLKDGYSGSVTLSYASTDKDGNPAHTVTVYEIADGKWQGADYIEIERKAYDMTGDILITVGDDTVSYNLAVYYHATATEVGALTNLLNALYAYCETATIYKDSL